jgi:hypothetical protein
MTVCLAANTLYYPEGGGHAWVYLNWALGLRAGGCRVIWLEGMWPPGDTADSQRSVTALRDRLTAYGLADNVALYSVTGADLTPIEGILDLDAATQADLLLNMSYDLPPEVVRRFHRTALIDIDPGLFQVWLERDWIRVSPHDIYFTTGETVGSAAARFPDAGLAWHYTPACVALDWWTESSNLPDAPFTTISNWRGNEWMEDESGPYSNDKRDGFMPFLDLPRYTNQPLELALCLGNGDDEDRATLEEKGWRVREADSVAATPWDYQSYIRSSRGEFSCAKPSCVRLQNAWISDRTLCYLASGKPAVVQHTGASRFLPDGEGVHRFRNVQEAAHALETVAADYERQRRLARMLAEEYFDAAKVVCSVLERAVACIAALGCLRELLAAGVAPLTGAPGC